MSTGLQKSSKRVLIAFVIAEMVMVTSVYVPIAMDGESVPIVAGAYVGWWRLSQSSIDD